MVKAFPRSPGLERVLDRIRSQWLERGCPGGASEDAFIAFAVCGFDTEAERVKHANLIRNYYFATRLGDTPSLN